MAARNAPLTTPKLDEMRRRIKTTLLLKKLEDHALGNEEMTMSQIRAAEITLKKAIPDLQSVEHSGSLVVRTPADELADLNRQAAEQADDAISKARSGASVA